ncbi:tripartite tricarboxylate transporter permease [Oceanobacillus kapialis]|uniref:tripartite tricarboxylate transporter permease n=1 Tax=Oceanobacillus kapialis TaxID=481353 RepID=UPI003851790E
MLENIMIGLSNIGDPFNLFILFAAVSVGFVGGAIPGISGTMLIVILLPLTYGLDANAAFILLTAIYATASFSGAISAILFRTPGTPEAVATVFDGYPMAQNGKAGRALGIAIFSSATGGIVGTIFLITLTPLLSNVALSFSSPEYFALAALGLTVVASLSGKDIIKGLIGVLFGLMLATVGMDALTGTLRYTFGSAQMTSGIELIPVLIGLFAVSEFLKKSSEITDGLKKTTEKVKTKIFEMKIFKKIYGTMARSSLIGVFIGILPGIGATTAAMLSYSETVRWTKNPEPEFGKGNPKGISASETSNNAAAMGTLVPLLSLGIPGGATTAVILGAFILHGMQPGPTLFRTNSELMYTIFAGLLIANILILILAKPFIRVFTKIVNIPYYVMGPLILILCMIGTYAVRNSYFDVWIMFIFGFLGFFLEKMKFPLATIILGVVLGPIAESEFRRSVEMANGDLSIFFTRPISLGLLIVAVLMLFFPIIMNYIKKRKAKN